MRRILLKLSGEYLQDGSNVLSPSSINSIVKQVVTLVNDNIEIGIVIGGGNIFRGAKNVFGTDIDRRTADSIGMTATCVNALALKAALQCKTNVKVYGAFAIDTVIQKINLQEICDNLAKKTVVIFAGGTGHAFFSTDTAAALRACEIKADILLKATNVDGVYEKDPKIFKDAKRFDRLTYKDVLFNNYKIMDSCAFALCKEQNLPIFIFNLLEKDAIIRAVSSNIRGTLITG